MNEQLHPMTEEPPNDERNGESQKPRDKSLPEGEPSLFINKKIRGHNRGIRVSNESQKSITMRKELMAI